MTGVSPEQMRDALKLAETFDAVTLARALLAAVRELGQTAAALEWALTACDTGTPEFLDTWPVVASLALSSDLVALALEEHRKAQT